MRRSFQQTLVGEERLRDEPNECLRGRLRRPRVYEVSRLNFEPLQKTEFFVYSHTFSYKIQMPKGLRA